MFEGFKVVVCCVWYSGAVNNSKVGGHSDGCIASSGGYKVVVGVWVFGFG